MSHPTYPPCPDELAGKGCPICDAIENALATEAGHAEACWYTLKASTEERLEHYRQHEPPCEEYPLGHQP